MDHRSLPLSVTGTQATDGRREAPSRFAPDFAASCLAWPYGTEYIDESFLPLRRLLDVE